MNNLYKILSFLFLLGIFFSVCAHDYIITFKPDVKFRKSETPGFMNAYCDTSVVELAKIENEENSEDSVQIDFYLDMDFPATDDNEFNSNLLALIDSAYLSNEFFVDYSNYYEDYDNNLYMADSTIIKVTSYNDSTLSMFVEKYCARNSEWREERRDSINFDKKTKTRFYKDINDSISMWSKSGYDGESYSISDYLITVHHYVPESTWGTGAYCGKSTKTTIVDRKQWTPILPNEIVWCDEPISYEYRHNSFLDFLMTLELTKEWGCANGDSAANKRFDVSKCHENHWYIDTDDLGTAAIGAYEEGVTIYLERCPGYRWYEAPVSFTYDEIYEFLIPGTAVYEAAENYCKTHKPTQFDKEYYGDSDSSRVRSLYIDFDTKSIETTDNIYEISFPASLQKAKKLSKTWCWVDPQYHKNKYNETTQRGKNSKIPKKIKYEGFHHISENGDTEISVRIFTNLVKDYPELIPTLTTSTDCLNPDFHVYDLPGEKLSKQYIYRGIDTESKDLIEIDIRCLPERAFYYEIASYMMFNCFDLEEYNEHYMLK
ncbi:MAG: hypothetical protein IJJ77_09610 [Paludibacteraceae bacterium]|nr:hypothetical protein [Paludibacteraceae bacterium]